MGVSLNPTQVVGGVPGVGLVSIMAGTGVTPSNSPASAKIATNGQNGKCGDVESNIKRNSIPKNISNNISNNISSSISTSMARKTSLSLGPLAVLGVTPALGAAAEVAVGGVAPTVVSPQGRTIGKLNNGEISGSISSDEGSFSSSDVIIQC